MNRATLVLAAVLALAAGKPGLEARKPEVTTRKAKDRVSVAVKGDTAVYSITSPSGIGGATLSPRQGWPKKVVLRLHLRGLERLAITSGSVTLEASVLSHSGHPRLLRVVDHGQEKEQKGQEKQEKAVEEGSPYWTKIEAFDAGGKAVRGLPGEGGYFEIELPAALFHGKPKSLSIDWIDFYRQ